MAQPSIGQAVDTVTRGFVQPALPEPRRVRAYAVGLCFVVIAYYGAAHLGYAFKFAGPVASIVWLPAGVGIAALYLLGPQLVARSRDRRSAGQQLLGAAARVGRRPELREPARGPRRGDAAAQVRVAQPAARIDHGVRWAAVRAAGRNAGQRDGRLAVDGGGRRGGSQLAAARVAYVVARGSVRRADRGAACDRVAAAAASALVRRPARGVRARARGARRSQPDRLELEPPVELPGAPRVDLGRAPLRSTGRDAGDRDRGRADRLGDDPLSRPVRVSLDEPQHPRHAAVSRGVRRRDAVRSGAGARARAARRRAPRVSREDRRRR